MSELSENKTFMASLDQWTTDLIINPLCAAYGRHLDLEGSPDDWKEACDEVKKLIRERVLASYRNGQKKPASAERGARKWR